MFTHSRINENIESSTYNPEQMLGYSRNKTLCTEKKKKNAVIKLSLLSQFTLLA